MKSIRMGQGACLIQKKKEKKSVKSIVARVEDPNQKATQSAPTKCLSGLFFIRNGLPRALVPLTTTMTTSAILLALPIHPTGMPLRMTPNFEDLSCEFAFGQEALAVEDDPLMQEVSAEGAAVGNRGAGGGGARTHGRTCALCA